MNGVKTSEKPSTHSRFASYLLALRPWSFSASLIPVSLGALLSWKTTGELSIPLALATAIAVLCVHASGNLVNTFYDYLRGVDSKVSDDRTLVDHILSPDEVVRIGVITYSTASICLIFVMVLSPAKMEHLALLFFGGLSGSFLYTGGIGLKYYALGDIVILITFGPLAVLFSYVVQGGQFAMFPLIYAMPLALNTEAILHSNNTRDIDADKKAGAVTLAILIGRKASYIVYVILLFSPYVICAVWGVNLSIRYSLPLLTLGYAFKLEKDFRDDKLFLLPKRTAKLNLYFGLLYLISFSIAPRLPHLGKI
ncbi:predicted protein [Nematostella vectensis]|uniref:UbiA prenyltransferase domain-containing protein 1 homolog n=1 Tax=Nematostella vectensis TaxID=45351 RepID=A7RL49_NEMVE|nr:ubiA prenyltransferase domain-containing protein 1 [Nematostella vectensis]EDO47867.1 predicted protein [Nematostella vectensis]|eukprot:XP_001639930.1 predicted protein [Nematostella vectensis]